jgi:hypothetical protein
MKPLRDALKHMSFAEYPTIEVWEQFDGFLIDIEGSLMQEPADEKLESERRAKRRKLDFMAGRKVMQGLLEGYGSGDSEIESGDITGSENAMVALAAYDGSGSDSDLEEDNIREVTEKDIMDLLKRREHLQEWAGDGQDVLGWGNDSDEDNMRSG